jgi:hypothetical protein
VDYFSVSLSIPVCKQVAKKTYRGRRGKTLRLNAEVNGQHQITIYLVPVKCIGYLFTQLFYDVFVPGLVICQFRWLNSIEWQDNCE